MAEKSSKTLTCVIHCSLSADGEQVLEFSASRWQTIIKYSQRWICLDGLEREIAETLISQTEKKEGDGYHNACYKRFTHLVRVELAEKRIKKGQVTRKPSPRKPVSHSKEPRQQVAARIVGPSCIFCKKNKWLTKKSSGARSCERLVQVSSETSFNHVLDYGRHASRDDIVKWMEGKSFTTIEVKYHNSCSVNYKNLVSRKQRQQQEAKPHPSRKYLQMLIDIIIKPRLQAKQEIWPLAKLAKAYRRMAFEHEGIRLQTKRYFLGRLQKRFPEIKSSVQTKAGKRVKLVYFGHDDAVGTNLEATEIGSCSSDSDSDDDCYSDDDSDEEPTELSFSLRSGSRQGTVSQTQAGSEEGQSDDAEDSSQQQQTPEKAGETERSGPAAGSRRKDDNDWLPLPLKEKRQQQKKVKPSVQRHPHCSLNCVCRGKLQTRKPVFPFVLSGWNWLWRLKKFWAEAAEGPEKEVMMGLKPEDKTQSGYHVYCYSVLCNRSTVRKLEASFAERHGTVTSVLEKKEESPECVVLPSRLRSRTVAQGKKEKDSETLKCLGVETVDPSVGETAETLGTEDAKNKTVPRSVNKECNVLLHRVDVSQARLGNNDQPSTSGSAKQQKPRKRKAAGKEDVPSLAKAAKSKWEKDEEIPIEMEVEEVCDQDSSQDLDPSEPCETNSDPRTVKMSHGPKCTTLPQDINLQAYMCSESSSSSSFAQTVGSESEVNLLCVKTEEEEAPLAKGWESGDLQLNEASKYCEESVITVEVKMEVQDSVE